ncbi:MAG TPA: adenine phosphoribosyltransferase [Kineosporiaceae bacterium]
MSFLGEAPIADRILARVRDVPDHPSPGVLFKDITPLLADGSEFAAVVEEFAAPHRTPAGAVDTVVGIEARGFILAAPVAVTLGVGFVPVRKRGKLPHVTVGAAYDLEYGRAEIEVHRDAITAGQRVLIVDDVLATGGTAEATCHLVEHVGGVVAGVTVLMELAFLQGHDRLGGRRLRSLVTV